jgi:hypothetical protein
MAGVGWLLDIRMTIDEITVLICGEGRRNLKLAISNRPNRITGEIC